MIFHYPSVLESLNQLDADLKALAQAHHWPILVHFQLHLCIDEVLTNVISYAFGKDLPGSHMIEVRVDPSPASVRVVIRDDGKPFNPLRDVPPAQLTPNVLARKIGGLGVHFMREYMSELHYAYADGHNVLTLVKQFN